MAATEAHDSSNGASRVTAPGFNIMLFPIIPKHWHMANRPGCQRLREQSEEIAEVQADFPDVTIFAWVERGITGVMARWIWMMKFCTNFDIVIASVHLGFNFDEATQTARMIKAISHPAVDIVAHPTGRVLGVRPATPLISPL